MNKRRMEISVTIVAMLAAGLFAVPSLAEPPLLHLTHRSESPLAKKLLRSHIELCKTNRPPPREPDWSKVGVGESDEYFAPTKYALYERSMEYEYEIPDKPGIPCKLIETKVETASLYDGKTDYEIDLVKRTGSKRERRYVDTKDQQQIGSAMGAAVTGGMLGNVPDTAQKIESLVKTAGQEQIAGEKSDCYHVKNLMTGKDDKFCYWSALPKYPGIGKDVTLRYEGWLGKVKQVQEVVRFRKPERIDSRVFSPPPGIKWEE